MVRMNRYTNYLVLLWFLLYAYNKGQAQVLFPEGHKKTMTTTLSVLYEETKIPFIIRNTKITNLSWRRLYDSVPNTWTVMACMNGTCIGGVPENGKFENLIDLPDSTGFLKYHFNFNDQPGRALIKYIIYNELLFNDPGDTVVFDITYKTNNGVASYNFQNSVTIHPNPSCGHWYISNTTKVKIKEYILYDMSGKMVAQNTLTTYSSAAVIEIDEPLLPKGMYSLLLVSDLGKRKICLIKK